MGVRGHWRSSASRPPRSGARELRSALAYGPGDNAESQTGNTAAAAWLLFLSLASCGRANAARQPRELRVEDLEASCSGHAVVTVKGSATRVPAPNLGRGAGSLW